MTERRTRTDGLRDPRIPVTMLAAVGAGLLAHGMALFNTYAFHDNIYFLFQTGTHAALGRWMLAVWGELEILLFGDGHYALPLVNGLFSLVCIGGMACLLVKLTDIRSRVFCGLLGAVMAVFPVVTAMFAFMYCAPYYFLAMWMTLAAAFLLCRGKRPGSRVLAAVLAGCAVGTYQACIPLLLTAVLLSDLRDLSEGDGDLKSFFRKIGIQAACIAGCMILYFVMSRVFLVLYHTEMEDYMGLNDLGAQGLLPYLERAVRAYREFFLPTRFVLHDMYPMRLYFLYFALLAGSGILALRLVIVTWRRNRAKAVLLGILLALFPLGCNFVFVMSDEVHGMMVYSQVFQAALFFWLLDRLEMKRARIRVWLPRIAAAGMALGCVMYIRYANQCYLKTEFQQQEALSWYTSLIGRIQSAEGYRADLPVLFVNEQEIRDPTLTQMKELDFISLNTYDSTLQGYLNDHAWLYFLRRWCGFDPVLYGADAQDPKKTGEKFAKRPEVQEMPHYPDEGSVRVVDGVLVVHF